MYRVSLKKGVLKKCPRFEPACITLFSNQSLSIYKGPLEPWAYVRYHNNLYSDWFSRFDFYWIQKMINQI